MSRDLSRREFMGALELYNLKDNIGEQKNLAKTLPEKTKALHKLMLSWRKALNAPVPNEPNPDYAPGMAMPQPVVYRCNRVCGSTTEERQPQERNVAPPLRHALVVCNS